MKKSEVELACLDRLIEEITTDANGEGEQLWAFLQAFEIEVAVPCGATLAGAPVQVVKFDFDGNERRELTAVCRTENGRKHVVAASDVSIPLASQAGRYLAAYRRWMGVEPFPRGTLSAPRRKPSADGSLLPERIELAVSPICKLFKIG